jgi:hypothetical protein
MHIKHVIQSEFDAGASPTASEPTWKARDIWASANTNFEIYLGIVART